MSSPGSSCTLRRATSEDLDRLTPLFGAYREFYRQAADPAAEREFLARRFARGEAVVFLAELEGEAVGFTLLYPSFSSISLRPIFVLNDLYVRPQARRTGVGARLLRHAHAFAAREGADYVTLETAKDNPAQHLYEAEGWRRDEEFLHYERKV
jgi:ribosomal protein S18 acetylase RimI-like enzyme